MCGAQKEAVRLRDQWSALKVRELQVQESEELARKSHNKIAKCAEEEVSTRWKKLEEVRSITEFDYCLFRYWYHTIGVCL